MNKEITLQKSKLSHFTLNVRGTRYERHHRVGLVCIHSTYHIKVWSYMAQYKQLVSRDLTLYVNYLVKYKST